MTDLFTRLKVDNSKDKADHNLTVSISNILSSSWIELKIDNSKELADNFRSISLGEIQDILNGGINEHFNLLTRIQIDNSKNAKDKGNVVSVEDVIVILDIDEGGGGDYVGPLDIISGAVVAYSQRAMSAAKRGTALYTIREDSGDTTQSFNSDATTGEAPVAAITAFLSGANGFLAIWNDQSGNGIDAAQASGTHQPGWGASSLGSLPGLNFLRATQQFLATASLTLANGEYAAFIVVNIPGENQSNGLFGINGQQDPDGFVFAASLAVDSSVSGVLDALATSDDFDVEYVEIASDNTSGMAGSTVLLDFFFTVGSAGIFLNGVSAGANATSDLGPINAISGALGIGSSDADPSFVFPDLLTGTIGELVIYNTIPSSGDRLAIRQNIATYYGITLS